MLQTEVLEPTAGVDETQPTAEVPAAPEGAAPSAPGDEPAITEPAASLSTRPRGPDGRFIKADGTQASEAEHAAIEAAAPPSPLAPITPPPVAPAGTPFQVRGDGQRLTMPGSTLNEKGDLTVLAEHVPQYRQLIAEGLAHRGSWRQEKQRLEAQAAEASSVEKAAKEKYHAASMLLFDKLTDQQWLAAAAQDPREIQHLIRELGLELKSADLKAPKVPEAAPVDAGRQEQQLETAARSTLAEYVEELLDTPPARAIYSTPEERKQVLEHYNDLLAAFFVHQDGEYLLHENAVDKLFQRELKLRQAGRERALADKKAQEFNAKRNAPTATVPPVVSTKGPGSNGAVGTKKYESAEEWRKAMGLN